MDRSALKSKMALNNDTGITLAGFLNITDTTLSAKSMEKLNLLEKK